MPNEMSWIYLALGLSAWGWFRAERRLARMEGQLGLLLKAQGYDPTQLPEPSAKVLDLASAGQHLAAIKAYREQTGAGLKESKDVIERALAERSAPDA